MSPKKSTPKAPHGVVRPAITKRADPNGPRAVDLEKELRDRPVHRVPKPSIVRDTRKPS